MDMSLAGVVQFRSYKYWNAKAQFALEKDIYPCWTLLAVESGRFSFQIGDNEGEAGFGEVVVCPPETWFHRQTLSPLSFHFLQFTAISGKTEEDADKWTGKIRIEDTERLASNFRYLRLMESEGEPQSARIEHFVTDFLTMIEMERERKAKVQLQGDNNAIRAARQHLLDYADDSFLNIKQVADQLKMTPVQLTRRFRAAYGQKPSAYLSDLRLGKACRLLEETPLTIDVIARRCGYENGFYLSRVFRKKKGMTPSRYRTIHRV
jgi:AraC family transcriptional regulator